MRQSRGLRGEANRSESHGARGWSGHAHANEYNTGRDWPQPVYPAGPRLDSSAGADTLAVTNRLATGSSASARAQYDGEVAMRVREIGR